MSRRIGWSLSRLPTPPRSPSSSPSQRMGLAPSAPGVWTLQPCRMVWPARHRASGSMCLQFRRVCPQRHPFARRLGDPAVSIGGFPADENRPRSGPQTVPSGLASVSVCSRLQCLLFHRVCPKHCPFARRLRDCAPSIDGFPANENRSRPSPVAAPCGSKMALSPVRAGFLPMGSAQSPMARSSLPLRSATSAAFRRTSPEGSARLPTVSAASHRSSVSRPAGDRVSPGGFHPLLPGPKNRPRTRFPFLLGVPLRPKTKVPIAKGRGPWSGNATSPVWRTARPESQVVPPSGSDDDDPCGLDAMSNSATALPEGATALPTTLLPPRPAW
jgi:hypothetical protein